METSRAVFNSVRFYPSHVVGVPDVSEVIIFCDRMELKSAERWRTFPFRDFAQRRDSILRHMLRRALGLHTRPAIVGQREFCTTARYFRFFTTPQVEIFLPRHLSDDAASDYFIRVHELLGQGGYCTEDLS